MSLMPEDMQRSDSSPQTSTPVRLNRTCQGCRHRRIKCLAASQDSPPSNKKCTRCLKLDIECVFLAPAIKKTRRRNETRIKELERKFKEIQSSLGETQAASLVSLSDLTVESDAQFAASSKSHSPGTSSTLDSLLFVGSFNSTPAEPLPNGVSSHGQAEELYWEFVHNCAPLYPVVHIPESLTCELTRTSRPAFFRAILTAASSTTDPRLSRVLFQGTGRFLAEKVIVEGEKSLDLVQALLVMATWQQPPEKFQGLKFSQSAQMAATMVMDLQSSNDEAYSIPDPTSGFIPSDQLVETCRTFIACYFLCSSIAFSFRRPSALHYGSWVERCIKVLERSPFLHLNDRRLVAWTKLQRLAEESLTMVGFDDGTSVDFSDARTRFILKHCSEMVIEWRQSVADDIMCGPLEMHYQMILIAVDEPALYYEHNISDFRPPYAIRALPLASKPPKASDMKMTAAITQCAASAQRLISYFLGLPTDVLRSAPVITYTRMAYAAVVLVKVYVSTRANGDGENPILNAEWTPQQFVWRIVDKLDSVAGQKRLDIPVALGHVLSNLARWVVDNLDQNSAPGEVLQPMVHLPGNTAGSESSSIRSNPNHLISPEDSQHVTRNHSVAPVVQTDTFASWTHFEDFTLLGDVHADSFGVEPFSGLTNGFGQFDFNNWQLGN
ncbi:hypothetical protein B0J13DRAFT_447937 [Dactylonectria estremocensis]|uniref:Zn(2)-C6 fungal-type domain-containing protein n=1 Tax=Dactylonectria estremocensis TaxID=1079267 RepID=A0A9P9IY13_9HYPO|nr:hypothetical protein B0J13DRAFT_447937 [Dactylonectria estremocensis]